MTATTIVINDVEPRRQYTAASGQTVFDFPIPFFDDGDLEVYLTPAGQSPDDAADLLTITTEYTVAGANTQDGGEITLVTPATLGDVITIERIVDIDRLADYQVAGDLLAETLNAEQDTEIMISQQLRQDIDRAIKRSRSSSSGADLTLPEPEPGKHLAWDATGNAIINDASSGQSVGASYIDEVQTATAGQTVFTLTDITYTPAVRNLSVYVNGVRQHPSAYTETSSTVITFSAGLDAGDEVLFVTGDTVTTAVQNASSVTYVPEGTGAVTTNVQDKLRNIQIDVEDFGAVGDWNGTTGTDDTLAIQAALDHLESTGGGTLQAKGRYRITDTLNISGRGIKLEGVFPEVVNGSTVTATAQGLLYADFTSGPVILIDNDDVCIDGLTVQGSSARRAATKTTGVQNSNSGILIENDDNGTDTIQNVSLNNLKIVSHPADGILIEGDVSNVEIISCFEIDCGRHGIAITSGQISGRTNTEIPGIINIEKGKAFDIGGHGVLIGTPTASASVPYRINIKNWENYRCALDSGERYSTEANWVVGMNIRFESSAFSGTTTGNTADHAGLIVGGRDVVLKNCRYINCSGNYIAIQQHSGLITKNLVVDGGIAVTTGSATDFATLVNGPDGITIQRVEHDCSNTIDTLTVQAGNNNVTLHELDQNRTEYHNHEYDYRESTVRIGAEGSLATISSGAISCVSPGYYKVDTESSAGTDNLDFINNPTYVGQIIVLSQSNSGRVVTIRHAGGGGNIRLSGGANFTFSGANHYIQLMWNGTNWYQIAPAVNNA